MNKKIILLISFASILFIITSSFLNAGGSKGAKTGSPIDGNNCTQCHSGTAQNVSSWITTDIPAGGYIANQTYTITLDAVSANVVKFGFELTSESASNGKVGSYIVTNSTETKLINNNHAITHTGNGNTPDNDSSKTWSFDWTAPASGTGDVKLYAAILAANGNMSPSGDITFLSTLEIAEDITSGISNNEYKNEIRIFPTIVENELNIDINNIKVNNIRVYQSSGKLILEKGIDENRSNHKLYLDNLSTGIYIVLFDTNKGTVSKRFIKN